MCGASPVDGGGAEGPCLTHVPLPEDRQKGLGAGAVHQHPVAPGGVQVGHGVQGVAVVAKTGSKGKHEVHLLGSPRKTISEVRIISITHGLICQNDI